MAAYCESEVNRIFNNLDDYMLRTGKLEIGDIEANCELERNGLMPDDARHPGKPLRELLRSLRDADLLPRTVRQLYGAWKIKHSKTMANTLMVFQF